MRTEAEGSADPETERVRRQSGKEQEARRAGRGKRRQDEAYGSTGRSGKVCRRGKPGGERVFSENGHRGTPGDTGGYCNTPGNVLEWQHEKRNARRELRRAFLFGEPMMKSARDVGGRFCHK